MALVNHAKKEINAKIVYYGPPGSGKNNALTYIYSRIKPSLRGDLKSVPAGLDNLTFFDFSPFETPLPHGYHVRLHIYTLTGIVKNPATWKMTLKGTDGIIIMVKPAAEHTTEARECVSQLRGFLSAYGVSLNDIPAVLQLNSFTSGNQPYEAADIVSVLELSPQLVCRSNTANGDGLLEALTALSRQVLDRITVSNEQSETDIASPLIPAEPEQPEMAPHADDSPKVALLSTEVVSEGGNIRIPLEIKQGDVVRRIIVTVNLELE